MKPADLNIYCCIIYAVCCHSPEGEQDPERGSGVSQSLALNSLPQPATDLWEPPNDLVWPQISLFSCVKWGHLNAACRQVDGVPLLPVRPVRETGENPVSMRFSASLRFFFFFS